MTKKRYTRHKKLEGAPRFCFFLVAKLSPNRFGRNAALLHSSLNATKDRTTTTERKIPPGDAGYPGFLWGSYHDLSYSAYWGWPKNIFGAGPPIWAC